MRVAAMCAFFDYSSFLAVAVSLLNKSRYGPREKLWLGGNNYKYSK